jgi:hypothetical protein
MYTHCSPCSPMNGHEHAMLPGSRKAHVGRWQGASGEGRGRAEERSCSCPSVGAHGGEGEHGQRVLQGRLVILPHGVPQ